MDTPNDGDWIGVTEAAGLLGIHPNSVRYRIKQGRYPSRSVWTPNGEARQVQRSTIQQEMDRLQTRVKNPVGRPRNANAQPFDLSPVLAPILEQIGGLREELGKVKAERDAAIARAEIAEARLLEMQPPVLTGLPGNKTGMVARIGQRLHLW